MQLHSAVKNKTTSPEENRQNPKSSFQMTEIRLTKTINTHLHVHMESKVGEVVQVKDELLCMLKGNEKRKIKKVNYRMRSSSENIIVTYGSVTMRSICEQLKNKTKVNLAIKVILVNLSK